MGGFTAMRKRGTRYVYIVVILSFAVVGCTAGVRTPELRISEDDGKGRFIYGCRNISPDAVVEEYITDFYLSTWRSAWFEGAQEGFQDSSFDVFPLNYAKREALGNIPEPYVYCRAFDYPFDQVAKAVETTFPRLQIPIATSNAKEGIFETEYAYRHHDFKRFEGGILNLNLGQPSRWKVRYQVGVHANPTGGADVLVFRELHISRYQLTSSSKKKLVREKSEEGPTMKKLEIGPLVFNYKSSSSVEKTYWQPDYTDENSWSDYHFAYSDGGNEGWLLTQIDRELKAQHEK